MSTLGVTDCTLAAIAVTAVLWCAVLVFAAVRSSNRSQEAVLDQLGKSFSVLLRDAGKRANNDRKPPQHQPVQPDVGARISSARSSGREVWL